MLTILGGIDMEFQNYQQNVSSITLQKHMAHSFGWMFLGVLITFAVSFGLSMNEMLMYRFLTFPFMSVILLVGQIGVCIALGIRLMKMSVASTKVLFIAYSVLTGVTFSVLPFVYDFGSLTLAFLITCIFFGCLAVIGATTRMNLAKIGTICMAGLMAMIIYTFIGMIFNFSMDSYLYSVIGLVLFMGITAWDVQKMKHVYNTFSHDETMLRKMGIYSAFQLYLDFINIFLYVLRFLGNDND